MSKKLQTKQKVVYGSGISKLKIQFENEVYVIGHTSYLALMNLKTNDPVMLTSIFETVNKTINLGYIDIFKNIVKLKRQSFTSLGEYEHISLTCFYCTVICEYLRICQL